MAKSDLKTKRTDASVTDYIAAIEVSVQRLVDGLWWNGLDFAGATFTRT